MRPGALLFALIFLSASSFAQDSGPEELIRKVTNDVLETIHNDKLLQAGDRRRSIALFEERVQPHLDFSEGARLAVGPAWSKASREQQEQLIKEFHSMMVRIYSSMISVYRGQTMRVQPAIFAPGATEATVRNQYLRPGRPPVPVDYAMRKTAAGWKIYDLKVDGISLILTYRADFEQVLRDTGIEGLIKRMKEKNLPPAT